MLLGSTVVLRRKFDPEECLRTTQDERCESLVVIPVMLQRILALPDETLESIRPVPGCKVVAASGSALPGDLALEWMDRFGDNLYNIYGSTEVAYASIANPVDLREAPSSAGKPPHATIVKILDEDGKPVPDGESGRIFVGNALLFEGYTGGGHKEIVDGLMSSGDVGRFGDDGRLYVEGRDDEMIVSGGENVFPKEVEDCLARHESVVEVAAIGVDDDDFGKRLQGVRRGRRATSPRTTSRAGSRRTSPATRCRARSSSSTSCRATPPARCSSASWPRTTDPAYVGTRRRGCRCRVGGWRHHEQNILGPQHRAASPSAGRRPTSRCATSSARTSRCRRTAAARRWRSSSTPTPSPGSAPARWPASATGSTSS